MLPIFGGFAAIFMFAFPLPASPEEAIALDATNYVSVQSNSTESSFTDAELEDLRVWAAASGTTFEQATRWFAGQTTFQQYVDLVAGQNPESFLHAEWVPGERPYGVLSFKGESPPSVMDQVAKLPVNIELVSGRDQNFTEFSDAVQKVYFALTDPVKRNAVTVEGDPALGVIIVSTFNGEAEITEEELIAATNAAGQNQLVFDEVESFGEQIPGPESSLGGRGWADCTAGFSVRRGTVYGMSTAHHCTSIGLTTPYQGTSMAAPAAPVSLAKSSGDVMWRRTVSLVTEPRFQAVTNGYRLVSATANPAVGTAICKFGVATGQTCGTVANTSVCSSGYCGLSRVGSHISQPGDSGGPWFFGNTAMGIHHGSVQAGAGLASGFTRIGALNLLNTVVLTG